MCVVVHKSEQSIRDIAANVTAINRVDLKPQLATSVADVFQYAPGIDYEAAGTRFGTEGINIRGIGGKRVALIVDGVPLSELLVPMRLRSWTSQPGSGTSPA